jgi:hypothetical protein
MGPDFVGAGVDDDDPRFVFILWWVGPGQEYSWYDHAKLCHSRPNKHSMGSMGL